jgi:hypothetical protein
LEAKLERSVSLGNSHKIVNLEKDDFDLLKTSGVSTGNLDEELSQKCLSLKNIDRELNMTKNEIKTRTFYGFLGKQNKYKTDYYQKRWAFIISSRPVKDFDYINDDTMLEEKVLPGFLAFDTLYYYSCDSELDNSEAKGMIAMCDCHEIQKEDRDDSKFYLILDLGERKFEFQSDFKGERDGWFETLVNSRRTAKDIRKSITKKPRNVEKLLAVLEFDGIGKVKDICEVERDKCVYGTTNM